MRPSITKQLKAEWIDPTRLKDSPRNYNASNCVFSVKGYQKVWMAYRSHRMDQEGRCGIAICELDGVTPKPSQWLDLGNGKEHHEDPRLFVFKGKLHVSYSETTFRYPLPYIAVQKYARLEWVGSKWKVAEIFHPYYGDNHAQKMEKNWMFFEADGVLRAIYASAPQHIVITLDGDKVVGEDRTPGVTWPWGEIRGGSPPVEFGDSLITFFHSSTPTIEGTWRRYWMGAYVMDRHAPFTVRLITPRPLAGGSEQDDHGRDPRPSDSWKPLVVFPGGAVAVAGVLASWDVAMGINDWRIAVARVDNPELAALNSAYEPRYFRTGNASRPVRLMHHDRAPFWLEWDSVGGFTVGTPVGYAKVDDPWIAEELYASDGVDEVSEADYVSVLHKSKRGR
jgi:predicted GH43/DUF377 family glycosyl hydrolase